MENAAERGFDWVGLPVIAILARLLRRELTFQNEYLRLENRILKEKASGRIRFADEECRSLMEAALAMGRSLPLDAGCTRAPLVVLRTTGSAGIKVRGTADARERPLERTMTRASNHEMSYWTARVLR